MTIAFAPAERTDVNCSYIWKNPIMLNIIGKPARIHTAIVRAAI